jgi:transposase
MGYYAGLDVSLKETFVSIIDMDGKVVKEGFVVTGVATLCNYLGDPCQYERIGIESGQLSISLCKGLRSKSLPVTCVDARHMAAALSARINKNDKNDGRGIAQMMRAGLYKEVQIKSDGGCETKLLMGSRRQLVNMRCQTMGTIRGLLKIYGIILGSQTDFIDKVRDRIKDLSNTVQASIEALLSALKSIEASVTTLDLKLGDLAKKDEDCQRLMTIPGVGAVTAMTYKTALDAPDRFDKSSTVGAYFGMTPRQYASGEVNRQGSISKMGPKECRTMLYEAAQSLLTRCKSSSKLKSWGLKLLRKKGKKKAIVAVARKLAVIMHRMLINKTEFCAH